MTDPVDWKPLSPAFTAALRTYDQAARARVLRAQRRDAITAPLFHYTDRGGLNGIITNGQFWFTHYQHLNDDKEITFGMEIANAVLAEFGARWRRAEIFSDVVADLFSADNLNSVFDFYIGSFSRSRDDLHQWKNYAACGQGFAIGLAPRLFGIEPDRPDRKPDEIAFVSPVSYGDAAARALHRPAIESAVRIAAETAEHKAAAMQDINRGMPFFRELANRLVAAELILNCLLVKGPNWQPEHEVRLFILGERANLAPYVSTRSRCTETVPFIKHRMPLREPDSITEILIGPAAPPEAEDFACSLLAPFHPDPMSIVHRSAIPPMLGNTPPSPSACRLSDLP
jgi:hypothetical protein